MRVLLAGIVVALALAAPPAAAGGTAVAFDVGSHPVVERELPGFVVEHDLPAVFVWSGQATRGVPLGPEPSWRDDGLALRERESPAVLVIPWYVNMGETRVDQDHVYPFNVGDVQYDLRDQAETTIYVVSLLVPGLPSTTLASRVPDLQLGLSVRDGALNGCVGDCVPAALDQALAAVHAPASFARGFAAAHLATLPVAQDAALRAPLDPTPGDASPAHLAASGPGGLAAESVGPAGLLPSVDAATAAALVLAAGLLLLAGPAALYSKIRRDSTLENETRRVIYEAVVATPGLSIQDVARRASVSHSTAAYHLERLSSAGLVVATGDGNKVRYYRNGGRFTEQERKLLPILENAETVHVLATVMDSPWTYRAEIAQKLGVTATTVNWHLKRLFGCAVLTERREGRNAYLFVERASLHVALTGLHEKLQPSPPRDVAAKLLAQLGPVQMPPEAAPAAPTLASLPTVPPPNHPTSHVTVAGTVYPRLAKSSSPQMGFTPSE
ncbi:MAG: winged helix-turn-helix transcriptional regulator [Halobacteriales archaeon]|nr:winged helix-turn-helix transcriptional regulator [Halobacteriales archaeon]